LTDHRAFRALPDVEQSDAVIELRSCEDQASVGALLSKWLRRCARLESALLAKSRPQAGAA
jgi:hypothetical protein